jgi:pyruvate/2-oxoglutarate dehydrogenase complex dihydrolipoamide dehydrogenase (E3) component
MAKTIQSYYDNLIIGFGKGGKTLAAWLAERGEQVALVEMSDKMYGGACINVACIPTKMLIKKAEEKVPYQEAYSLKNELTAFLRELNFNNLEKLHAATVITGQASFVSPNEVLVKLSNSPEEKRIRANRIFINTGSQPSLPPIEGIDKTNNVFTNISLLEQSALPRHLVIIGGGFIGLEFADMYANFGAKVTVLDSAATFLPGEDEDVVDEVYNVLSAKKINIVTGAIVEKIDNTGDDKVQVRHKNKTGETVFLHASALLVATGRKPMTDGLNLEAAGIRTNEKGYIAVDASLKTNVSNIWAIGDINGGAQFTYISLDDFRIIRDQLSLATYTSVQQRKLVATSVFITPPLAQIGLRENEAVEKGYEIKVAKLPATSIVGARIEGDTRGFIKTVVEVKTNKILGCTFFCTGANEMINTIQMAINCGMDYRVVRDTIYTHPSMTEAFNDLYALI